ncbi:predicted protein [Lichtheimia corymbifera JMRC:FSU:9682]|uniref:Uncharacterized protein n=1 Tax=Lichtheimia corymbifera JMRC:FSU:9682 TaxID=1263082 RepID=A0A068SBC2_9FUNG|nr:predicted protein [Lichtheimia corymbifera JMRC:FSU:9682]
MATASLMQPTAHVQNYGLAASMLFVFLTPTVILGWVFERRRRSMYILPYCIWPYASKPNVYLDPVAVTHPTSSIWKKKNELNQAITPKKGHWTP